MKIYFVRHGESEANLLHEFSNHGDKHPLTEKGRTQTKTLARNLERLPFQKIYTSPLKRARETAEILAGVLDVPFEITDALREGDCGILEGRSDAAAWAIYDQINNAWGDGDLDVRAKGGESFNDMAARLTPFIEKLVAENAGDIILVGHGSLYRFVLPELMINIDAIWAEPFPIENTAYILAETGAEGLVCVEWCGEKLSVSDKYP